MVPQSPSPVSGSSPSPTAPLAIELYTFDTLLLTFLGRKVASVILPSAPAPAQPTTTDSQDISSGLSDTNADADSDTNTANAATQMDQETATSLSLSMPSSPPPAPPNLIDGETLSTLLPKEEVSLPPSTRATLGFSDNNNESASSYPNVPSWLELLSPPPPSLLLSPSDSSSTSGSGRYSGNTNSGSGDFVGGKSTRVHGAVTATASPGGPGEGGGGGGKVRGGVVLAYQACQMLPEPIHLRYVNTTLLLPPPTVTISPTTNGAGVNNGSGNGSHDSYAYAIEYFADQGCTQFVMATAGTRVNVWQAELDLVERNSEKEEERYDGSTSGGSVTTHKRDGNNSINNSMQIARRQSSQPPATTAATAVVSPPLPTSTYTPWTPPPTSKQDLKALDVVVSVRWVGILKPTEFTISTALTASRQPLNPSRMLVDPLLERRSDDSVDIDVGNDGGADEDGDDSSDNPDTPSLEESEKGATGDGMSTPTATPTPSLGIPLQNGKDAGSSEGVVGFVSWIPFNETIQLQPPTLRDVGSIPLDETAFNLAYRGEINSINGTTAANPTGYTGIAHTTSQILMAGLIAGLLLILGSLLTAIYYRQRRRKWYEEDGEV